MWWWNPLTDVTDWRKRDARGCRVKWIGEELRTIRARNGVGRKPARQFGNGSWVAQINQVNEMYVRWSAMRERRMKA